MTRDDERNGHQAEGGRRIAGDERDVLLSALANLTRATPDPARSEALIARATRTIVRRRTSAQKRMMLLAGIYGRVVEPIAAGALSAAYLAAVFGQAILIVVQAHAGFLWR